jgi:AcrR family transcriptional regulator
LGNTAPIERDPQPASGSQRRMPRPERERQMLEVAGKSFAARGFHAVSMDEIAALAGISKPMLYHYFGSKEGLYVAYVRQQGNALLAGMSDATAPDAAPAERLWEGTLAFLGYVDEHRPGWALLFSEAVSQGGPLASEVAQLRARIAAIVHRLFLSVAGAGGGTSEALAHAYVGAGESVANWWLEHPDEPREHVARLLVRLAGGALPGLGEPPYVPVDPGRRRPRVMLPSSTRMPPAHSAIAADHDRPPTHEEARDREPPRAAGY